MKVVEYNKKTKNTKSKSEVEAMIKTMQKDDEKMVKGQFEFVDAEGGFFEFMYKVYPGENILQFQFIHGEICEIPMGVVRHLNGTKRKIRRYKDVEQPAKGPVVTPKPHEYETFSRIRFVPMDCL